jgi:hypothetical protein
MTPLEKKIIADFNAGLSSNIKLNLNLTKDDRSETLNEFCKELSELAPEISVKKNTENDSNAPSIQAGKRLVFHGAPAGTELKPFLEILAALDKNSAHIAENIRKPLNKITIPVELKLFVAQQCPFCPVMISRMFPLSFNNENIHLTIIDCTLFPELAEPDNIQSVPCVLLDEEFRWTGSTRMEEIIEVITNRDPAGLSASAIERICKEGNAADVAKMMIDKKMIFPAFFKLLIHEKWPVRLGAMVALEYITEKNRKLAAEIVDPLWKFFNDADVPVKGDIIHIVGETGDYEIIPKLKMILSGKYDDEIKNAAKEAVEKIENRYSSAGRKK